MERMAHHAGGSATASTRTWDEAVKEAVLEMIQFLGRRGDGVKGAHIAVRKDLFRPRRRES
jgi:hypothetical protein